MLTVKKSCLISTILKTIAAPVGTLHGCLEPVVKIETMLKLSADVAFLRLIQECLLLCQLPDMISSC